MLDYIQWIYIRLIQKQLLGMDISSSFDGLYPVKSEILLKRRLKTEEKAKVVAVGWGTYHLAARILFTLIFKSSCCKIIVRN